jgi:hypothetical protein
MRQTLVYIGIILLATAVAFGLIHERNKKLASLVTQCPTDVMMCPDGSSIPRSGPACEFASCKQEISPYTEESLEQSAPPLAVTPTSSQVLPSKSRSKIITTTVFEKVTTATKSIVDQVTGTLRKDISSGIKETTITEKTPQTSPNTPYPQQKPAINETRYTVEGDKLIDSNNVTVATLPTSSANSSASTMTTHFVNAVEVNQVTPIIGAVPVDGLPGKYYVSENSFGNIEKCEFINKIYILDTKTGTKTLMYEESSMTLSSDDPRACSSEMYLLATENEKLILKYHTIGTNMTCDSTWSEPEKTWYLDVTHLDAKTKRYYISGTLYSQAEAAEAHCRTELEATTTSQ